MRLTPGQVDDFFGRGWVVLPALFAPDELAAARAAFDRLHATAQRLRTTQDHAGARFVLTDRGSDMPATEASRGGVVVQRVVWAGGAEPALLDIGADPRLVGPALQLLGSERCEQLLCQAHFKMPGDGVSFDWHQDVQHRDKGPGTWRDLNGRGSYVQTLLAIDEMRADNGPLQFVPRAAVRLDDRGRLRDAHYDYGMPMAGGDDAGADDAVDVGRAETITGPAGSVIFFGPYAVHGSTPNTSATPRRVLINGYAYPGANGRVYPGEGSGRVLPKAAS
ncbi:MAG: phytanoyl-CoA dioxygenase family protein [Gammaproteobacteria bacterium]|jgi:ectoine hydroxylase-related dioxygenase (phytanoyl-CoA dioxygenase family)